MHPKELEQMVCRGGYYPSVFIDEENLCPRRQGEAARGRDKKCRREEILAAG